MTRTAWLVFALASIGAIAVLFVVARERAASTQSVAAKPALGWFTSGGGWRAMSVGMAVARNLHKIGALEGSALTHVAANSGGAWFLTQLGTRHDARRARSSLAAHCADTLAPDRPPPPAPIARPQPTASLSTTT
jgi:hypothetical protein